jgi:hypothetical protein
VRGALSVEEIWAKVRESVGPILSGILGVSGTPAILGPNALVLRFASRYTPQYDYCSQPRTIDEIQKTIQSITNQDWTFRAEIEASDGESRQDSGTEVQSNKIVTYRERSEGALQVPLVNWAVEKLGARLLKMDDGFGLTEAPPSEPETPEQQES